MKVNLTHFPIGLFPIAKNVKPHSKSHKLYRFTLGTAESFNSMQHSSAISSRKMRRSNRSKAKKTILQSQQQKSNRYKHRNFHRKISIKVKYELQENTPMQK